jgi:hypothetical protein
MGRALWIKPDGVWRLLDGTPLLSGLTEIDPVNDAELSAYWLTPLPASATIDELSIRGPISPWGIINASTAYYDTAGAAHGEEARMGTGGGSYWLEPIP